MEKTVNEAELRKQEDLFVRIALDNKLVSKWHVKKASEEQDRRAKEEGKRPALGQVLLTLGYLTDRQYQSVENAQRYREQRDYDKRIGRQCLRQNLLDQAKVEECLEAQKVEYTKTGAVKAVSQIFQEKGLLTPAQVESVQKAIEARDKAGRPGTSGPAARPSLGASGPVPVVGGERRGGSEEEITPVKLDEKGKGSPDEVSADPLRDAPTEEHEVAAADEDEDADEEDGDEAGSDEDGDDDEGEAGSDDEDADEDEEEESDDDGADEEADEDEDADEEDGDEEEEDEDDDEADEDELADDLEGMTDGDDVELDEGDLETIEELESGSGTGEEQGWAADAFDDRPLAKRSDTPSGAVPAEKATPSAAVPAAKATPSTAAPATAAPAAKAATPSTATPSTATPAPAAPAAKAATPPAAGTPAARAASGATPPGGTPIMRAPKTEPARTEATRADAPKPEPAKTEAPKAEPAKAEAPRPETKPELPRAARPDSRPMLRPEAAKVEAAKLEPAKPEPAKPAAKGDLAHSDESGETSVAARSAHDIPGGDVLEDSATASVPAPAAEPLRPTPAQEKLAASTRGLESFLKRVAEDLETPGSSRPTPSRSEAVEPASPRAATLAATRVEPASTTTASSTPPATVAAARPAIDPEDPRVRRAFERAMQKALEVAWKTFLEELGR